MLNLKYAQAGHLTPTGVMVSTGRLKPIGGPSSKVFSVDNILLCALVMSSCFLLSQTYMSASADNFTDLFYTQSFRGSFAWMQKLDWVGMILQAVISIFSVIGVSLVSIRIMTSILYLSSKGLWDEVNDLKESGGESEYFDFGFINMAKSWAKGKAGTGLDAIIGAILILLPNIKRYSDFGPGAGGKFDENLTVTQYMLKVLLPTIMIVFFCAMGFNGTLWQALAVTVDAMGTVADKAVSVNYAGFVDDLINTGTGYSFTFGSQNTNEGDLRQSIAKDVYGRCVSKVPDVNQNQLQAIGRNVEQWVAELSPDDSALITEEVREGLSGDDADAYWGYLGYEIVVNTSSESSVEGDTTVAISELIGAGGDNNISAIEGDTEPYIHLYLKQTKSFNGNFFNTDGISRN